MTPVPQNEKIGPYRLVRRLGAGGMGEVWEAWDERLERRVAAKQVLPEVAGDASQRHRFRREARMAARLTHPAVVQIFDLVERESGDWLVMEYVEGTTLGELLRTEGALSLDTALALASDIAEGLAEAHQRGLVHRDLKGENVLVTSAGRAKILDFGLAKPFIASTRDQGTTVGGEDEWVTAEGKIVGTLRAMSPEQAAGLALGPRSDLFAFGVLLYEMITGCTPFAGDSRVETLQRIYSYQPPPVGECDPSLPPALSTLIEELLEKEPQRRPADATEVGERLRALRTASSRAGSRGAETGASPSALETTIVGGAQRAPSQSAPLRSVPRFMPWLVGAVLVVLLGLVFWRLLPLPALLVTVRPVQMTATAGTRVSDTDGALVGAAVDVALQQTLTRATGVTVLPAVGEETGDARDNRGLLRATAADEMVDARLACGLRTALCTLSLRRLGKPDGRVLWADATELPGDDPALAATAAAAAIARAYPRRASAQEAWADVDHAVFADYLRLRRALERRDPGSEGDGLLRQVTALAARAPRFLEAHLLVAEVAKNRFFTTRDEVYLEQAFAALQASRALAPEDPRPVLEEAAVAVSAGRTEQAAAALDVLDQRVPGDTRIAQWRALLAERAGRSDEALSLMRRAVALRPSRRNLLKLANLEIRLGEIKAARATLDTLLSWLKDDTEALALAAQIELLYGVPEHAVRLYRELMARAPSVDERTNFGVALMLAGRFEAAAGTFRQARDEAPANAAIVLNLADAELLAGDQEAARVLYRQVLELVDQDAAAASYWNNLTIRAQALAHLGLKEAAVAATLTARKLAPDNPQVHYEAAIVYALVGDRASALVHARAALSAGVDRRWFTFPWFDALRDQLESAEG